VTKDVDNELLREIGMSDQDLRIFLHKLKDFIGTLTEPEKKILRFNLPSSAEAVKTFNVKVTQKQLHDFIKQREPDCAAFTCCVNGPMKSKPPRAETE
jgi:hypothetical protein